ncbi:lipid-A-disaccharide synthase [Marinomonas atlantica]|uniref:lipid-A-disaccharide synthase n=1 Tax=Marinomonas atlantica TaxID=1806668 RepID=UPI0008350BFA|nr:lipid-A-disaccharide synthase [Marinomonas atlantica]MCO4785113.1 lipid-A-disaccharide synthase [Marinomonas atlantica]
MQKRFVIVAGEASGDILGANLIKHLKLRFPDAVFEGIGGPLMIAQGFNSLFPMERLSVMGLVEVLGRLRELLGIRKAIFNHSRKEDVSAFIGIDSPDFNLPLARKLRLKGVKTIHYVSPSVWAWRQKRIFKIKESVDLMLTLFPFELEIYQQHQIPAVCVGHTLADEVPLESNKLEARARLGLSLSDNWFAILPGSRGGEVSRLMPVFAEAMKVIQQQVDSAKFVVPAANNERRQQIECILKEVGVSAVVVDGQSRDVMAAGEAIMLASGTAALEAMLVKRPMVVAYRFTKLTYAIMKRMIKVPYVSLPNLLARKQLVPELLQNEANPVKLANALVGEWKDFATDEHMHKTFLELHEMLRKNAGDAAARAIAKELSNA